MEPLGPLGSLPTRQVSRRFALVPPGTGLAAPDRFTPSAAPPPTHRPELARSLPRWGLAAGLALAGLGSLVGVFVQTAPAVHNPSMLSDAQTLQKLLVHVNPADEGALSGALGKAEPGVLRAAAAHGLKVKVLASGDDLFTAGILRPQDPSAWGTNLDADRGAVQQALAHHPSGSTTLPEGAAGAAAAMQMQAMAEHSRSLALDQALLDGTGQRYTVYVPPASPAPLNPLGGMPMPRFSASPAQMAAEMGWSDPAAFLRLFEAVNGPQLAEARAQLARSHPELLKHPDQIQLSLVGTSWVVPNLYNVQGHWVDRVDKLTLDDWTAGTGKVVMPESGPRIDGQHFADSHQFVVRREALADPGNALHELGHEVQAETEARDPGFTARLQKAYDSVGESFMQALGAGHAYHEAAAGAAQPISDYSRTNPKEYFAEGFRLYHLHPEQLKGEDPALFSLVQEAIAGLESVDTR